MKVIEKPQNIYNAYEFTDNDKDMIYHTISSCYGNGGLIPLFDDNGNPCLRVNIYKDKFLQEKSVHFGDIIILNEKEDILLNVISYDEFQQKYTYID